MSHIIFIFVLIKLEILTKLVDGIISQMHLQIIQIRAVGACVFLSRKSSEALVVNENPQRIDSVDQHVDAQVELEVVYRVGFVQIPLCDKLLTGFQVDVLDAPGEVNSAALTVGGRLNDESFVFLFICELSFEILLLHWQDPSFRGKLVIFRETFSHSI